MRLALTGRHVDVTPTLRALVTRRLARLERVLNDHALSTQVILSLEKRNFNTEVTVHARGDRMITGKGSAASWSQSIGEAFDKVMQQASKVKEKFLTRKRRPTVGEAVAAAGELPATRRAAVRTAALVGAVPLTVSAQAKSPAIRRTRYAVKPMSLEDAALRIEEAVEPFVIFRHAETERLTILYQRPDGRLGLIDPES
jgi:putative sigma-54 modulation protein